MRTSTALRVAGAGLIAALAMAPAVSQADPPCGRGWRKHERCGEPVYLAPRPIYVAPPQAVYVAPPPLYVPAPVYAPAQVVVVPQLSIGVNIPLR